MSVTFLLSIQDSNLDWLIQSQMCYHYTNGQSLSFLSKTFAKIQRFCEIDKFIFVFLLFGFATASLCIVFEFHFSET